MFKHGSIIHVNPRCVPVYCCVKPMGIFVWHQQRSSPTYLIYSQTLYRGYRYGFSFSIINFYEKECDSEFNRNMWMSIAHHSLINIF